MDDESNAENTDNYNTTIKSVWKRKGKFVEKGQLTKLKNVR